MQGAIPGVSPLAVALVGCGGVDAGGEEVAVVKAQPAFFHVGAGGVGPDGVPLPIVHVLQLHLHLHGPRGGEGLGLRAGGAERGGKLGLWSLKSRWRPLYLWRGRSGRGACVFMFFVWGKG